MTYKSTARSISDLKCQADFIITYNQRDLQAAEKFGIRVLTPKEFLQQVGELS